MTCRYLCLCSRILHSEGMRLPQSCSKPVSIFLIFIIVNVVFAAMLPLRAVAATQQLQCSPSSLKFGNVAVGQSEAQLVTVTNTGQTATTVSAISASVSGFTVSGVNLPLDLNAGQSVELNVIFAPTTVGWINGKVTFTSNASSSLKIGVAGTGAEKVGLTATPSSLSFGQVAVGSNATVPVVLTNTRSYNLTLSGYQAAGSGYSVSGPNVPYVLAAGKSVTLNVAFAPQSASVVDGSIWISGQGLNIPLTGTGTTKGVLTIAPTALNLGSVDVGSTTSQTSTMSATNGSVTVFSAVTNNTQFGVSGLSFPLTIGAGQSVTFSVNFSPSQSGSASGTLSVASNASGNNTTEGLSGTGVTPKHNVDLWWAPSSSSVAGYNVYRGTAVGSYTKINTALDSQTTYTDATVVSGQTYYYAATAVSSSGQESGYSSPVQVAVP